ncbi:MAG: NAD(P)/FAD-dependent oxidoreductase [Candidatus Bathyarchaeota archaeon]|nr:NAD(P)/FAD-dependent oxidoreductase [Candidatus Bathyarchaeota archaeon]
MQEPVAVVGAGPAGSFFAYELAKKGAAVTVFEEHPQAGYPSHCAGHLSIRSLRKFGLYPLPPPILENEFSAANFYSAYGTKFAVKLAKPVTCAVNRALFDQYLAQKAQDAGAQFRFNSRVQSLIRKNGVVCGVNVQKPDGSLVGVRAPLVVDAEGISSRLLRQAGLRGLRGDGLVYAIEAEITGARGVEEHAVEVYVGKAYAPGFYGWLIPRPDGTAKLGLATSHGNPKTYLQRLIQKHPVASKQLKHAKIQSTAFHAITLGGPIPQMYTDGFLAVGDCASQVKPTTGGGVIFSLTCAKTAAQTTKQALNKNDLSTTTLQAYQKQTHKLLNHDYQTMHHLHKLLNHTTDKKFDNTLKFTNKIQLQKALTNIDEIDHQTKTLLAIATKPQTYATLTYLLTTLLKP